MKKLNHITTLAFCIAFSLSLSAQEKNKLLLNLSYHNVNNYTQYLQAQAKSKVNGKLTLVPGLEVKFYINTDSASGFLGKAITDEQGNAGIQVPASAKAEWDKLPKPSFLAEIAESKLYNAGSASFDLVKAKLQIDTGADKKITATFMELKDSSWVPVKGVDMKIGIKRQGSILNVAETDSYTTDSLGIVSTSFNRPGLPGDSKGNLVIVAKIEDNDTYGNLTAEKVVPWGVPVQYQSNYDVRTLFARRGKAPIWLYFISFSIIISVWGVLIYLLQQIRKLKKLSTENS
ncbi:MAG TPA: hypothetical protein VMT76_16765 [Puia sp.]|nr:hypothetical protein [Puia sp.]